MKIEEAIKLLHPDTTEEVIAEIEYKHGFRGKQLAINKINEACVMACEAMEKQIPKRPYKDNENGEYEKYYCLTCNRSLFPYDHHCRCGQNIDWSDTE